MTTSKQVLDWLAANHGRGYDFDNMYGIQCMDLINQVTTQFFNANITSGCMYPSVWYREDGLNLPPVWETNLPPGWTRHKESQPGDIFITMPCAATPVGHIGFIAEDNSSVYDQNGTSRNDPITRRKGFDGIYVGFIRPPYEQSASAVQTATKQLGDNMNTLVIFKDDCGGPYKKDRVFFWSPQTGFLYIEDPAGITILDNISTHNIGKPMARIEASTKAPWHARLAHINGSCDIK